MNSEQLVQEARIEAEKVYPFKKGDDFSKGFNSEIVKINLDLLQKQGLFIEGYIANAKKQISNVDEFKRRCLAELNDAGFLQAMQIIDGLI